MWDLKNKNFFRPTNWCFFQGSSETQYIFLGLIVVKIPFWIVEDEAKNMYDVLNLGQDQDIFLMKQFTRMMSILFIQGF